MNERSKSDLLFEEDEEFIDALEEALDKVSKEYYRDKDKISLKTDEDEDPPLLIF